MSDLVHLGDNEILLSNYRLPITGRVQVTKIDQYAGKITIGKTNRSDQTNADEWTQDEWKDGGLRVHLDEQTDKGRFAYARNVNTWTRRKMCLSYNVTSVGSPVTTNTPVNQLIRFGSDLYCVAGTGANTKIYKLTGSGAGPWSASLQTLNNTVTDWIVYRGTLYLACIDRYWSYNGTTFTENTGERASYFTTYGDHATLKLVKWDDNGLAKGSADGTTWSATYKAEVYDVTPTDLATYVDSQDQPLLLGCHTKGMVVLDLTNQTSDDTSLEVLEIADAGKGTLKWSDGNLYFPAALSLWRYPKGGQIVNVGLDTDDGLPSFIRGRIIDLVNHPNFVFAVVDATAAAGIEQSAMELDPDFNMSVIAPENHAGYSALCSFNGTGWHFPYVSATTSTGVKTGILTTIYGNGERRLYFNDGADVKYMVWPEGNYDPTTDPNARFCSYGEFVSSIFDGGQSEVRKVASSLKFRTQNITSTEIVEVYYALNESENFTYLGTINNTNVDSDGLVTFRFGSKAGISFYSIQLKFVLRRGTDASKTPVIVFFNLRHKKLPRTLLGFTVNIVSSDMAHLEDVWARLFDISDSGVLVPFAYKNNDTKTYWVSVAKLTGIRQAGSDNFGHFSVTLIQLEHDT